jgi:hypothetical protein
MTGLPSRTFWPAPHLLRLRGESGKAVSFANTRRLALGAEVTLGSGRSPPANTRRNLPQRVWRTMKTSWLQTRPARLPMIIQLIFILVVLTPQAQDGLVLLAQKEWLPFFLHLGILLACLFYWAFAAWYWSRLVLSVRLGAAGARMLISPIGRWTPVILGTSPFLSVVFALLLGYLNFGDELSAGEGWKVVINAIATVIAAAAWGIFFFAISIAPPRRQTTPTGRFRLAGTSRAIFNVWLLVVLGLTLTVLLDPISPAQWLGFEKLLMIAAGAVTTVGSSVVYFGLYVRLPVLTLGLLLVVVIGILQDTVLSDLWPRQSWLQDNHSVRKSSLDGIWTNVAPRQFGKISERPAIDQAFDRWYARTGAAEGDRPPLILVAAAGGGVRAAAWTLKVLGELHETYPDFHRHLFSISTVSGGSLGAVIYQALVTDALERQKHNLSPRTIVPGPKNPCSLCADGREILQQDLLSPAVASLLFPELIQRLIPIYVLPDRAAALEQAWEAAFAGQVGSGRLAAPFPALWLEGESLPILFLNGASSRTGKRIITTNVRIDRLSQPVLEDRPFVPFPDSDDFFALAQSWIPASTAVNNTARFPYIGPAGTIRDEQNLVKDQIVDGGYFENFGASTTLDVLTALEAWIAKTKKYVQIIVIQISSDPPMVDAERSESDWPRNRCATEYQAYIEGKEGNAVDPAVPLQEAISPPATLWYARGARGLYATEHLRHVVRDRFHGTYVHFRLARILKSNGFSEGDEEMDTLVDAPLGWTLSRRAMDAIISQWERCEQNGSRLNLARYRRWLPMKQGVAATSAVDPSRRP